MQGGWLQPVRRSDNLPVSLASMDDPVRLLAADFVGISVSNSGQHETGSLPTNHDHMIAASPQAESILVIPAPFQARTWRLSFQVLHPIPHQVLRTGLKNESTWIKAWSMEELLKAAPYVSYTPLPQRGSRGSGPGNDFTWNPRARRTSGRLEEATYEYTGDPTPTGGYITMNSLEGAKEVWFKRGQRLPCQPRGPQKMMTSGAHQVTLKLKPGVLNKLLEHDIYADHGPDTDDSDFFTDPNDDPNPDEPPLSPECLAWIAMRDRLRALEDCHRLVYGIREEESDTLDLFICWSTHTKGSAASPLAGFAQYQLMGVLQVGNALKHSHLPSFSTRRLRISCTMI